MTLGEISEHLGKRGFVTRVKWCREYDNPEVVGTAKCVLVFGMDNVGWLCLRENDLIHRQKKMWLPCLDDIKATDWIELPYFWNGSQDDYLPFERQMRLVFSGCRGQSAYAYDAG
jgi:hypothetical protein